MAVAAVGTTVTQSSTASTTLSFSSGTPDATTTMMTVSVAAKDAVLADRTIASVTFDGSGAPVNLTKVGEFDDGTQWNLSHWYLPNPGIVGGTILITNSGAAATYIGGTYQGWNGTSGSGSFVGGTNSASAGSGNQTTTVNVATTAEGSFVIDVALGGLNTVTPTVGGNQTQMANTGIAADDRFCVSREPNSAPGTVTMSWSWPSNPFGWATYAWELLPVGVVHGGPSQTFFRVRLRKY